MKCGRGTDVIAGDDAKVRAMVEEILADIAKRGGAAIREVSQKFDGWDRDDHRLSDKEIRDCLKDLSRATSTTYAWRR